MLINRITVIMISFLSCLIFGCDDDSIQSVGDQGQGMRTIVDAQIQQDVAVVAADTGTQSADASSQDDAGLIVMDAAALTRRIVGCRWAPKPAHRRNRLTRTASNRSMSMMQTSATALIMIVMVKLTGAVVASWACGALLSRAPRIRLILVHANLAPCGVLGTVKSVHSISVAAADQVLNTRWLRQ